MQKLLGNLKSFVLKLAENPTVRKRAIVAAALFLVLQLYFVRELIAAELLFCLGFVVLLALTGVFYLVGTIGDWGFGLVEAGVKAASGPTRRGLAALEDVTRKSLRATRSESAHS